MNKAIEQILASDLLSEDTKAEITTAFKTMLDEAKSEQENKLRLEFAKLYEQDKQNIAEAVEQFVSQRMEKEIAELHADMKALGEQRVKYVRAQSKLKEQAQTAIRTRLAVFEKALQKAFSREVKELHEDMKVNRTAALKAITEAKAQAAADREAFKVKGAKVLEHIIKVKLESQLRELKEDIEKAKQSDFGNRIFEAFIGEARRLFFNSHKELRNMSRQLKEQQVNFKQQKAELVNKLNEAKTVAQKAAHENRQIKESAVRTREMSRLLSTMPTGSGREQMKTLLESTSTADLEKTFKKYATQILTESKVAPKGNRRVEQIQTLTENKNLGLRTGNGGSNDEDDEYFTNLRRIAGIN